MIGLSCIIPDLFTRRSSPCLLLTTISTIQFGRSRLGVAYTAKKNWDQRNLCMRPPTSNHPDGISSLSLKLFDGPHYEKRALKRSGTVPLFPNCSLQRHNSVHGLISRTHPHPNQYRGIQSNMFPNARYQCTNLWESRIPHSAPGYNHQKKYPTCLPPEPIHEAWAESQTLKKAHPSAASKSFTLFRVTCCGPNRFVYQAESFCFLRHPLQCDRGFYKNIHNNIITNTDTC